MPKELTERRLTSAAPHALDEFGVYQLLELLANGREMKPHFFGELGAIRKAVAALARKQAEASVQELGAVSDFPATQEAQRNEYPAEAPMRIEGLADLHRIPHVMAGRPLSLQMRMAPRSTKPSRSRSGRRRATM